MHLMLRPPPALCSQVMSLLLSWSSNSFATNFFADAMKNLFGSTTTTVGDDVMVTCQTTLHGFIFWPHAVFDFHLYI